MRSMPRLSLALFCLTLFSCEQDLEERLRQTEEIAEATYARSALVARTQHDIRNLFSKTDDELRTLGFRNPAALRAIYSARKSTPLWVTTNRLSPDGVAVTKMLDDAILSHGISPTDVHQEKRLELLEVRTFPQYALGLDDAERRTIRGILEKKSTATNRELGELIGGPSSPLPRIVESLSMKHRDTAPPSRLELLTTDAIIEFGSELRWGHSVWQKVRNWPSHLSAGDDAPPSRQLRNKRKSHVASLALTKILNGEQSVVEAFKEMEPKYEQYQRLVKAHRDYRTIVSRGGWRTLPNSAAKLSIGDVDAAVKLLKERLRAEGYWNGDDSAFFTEPLRESLKAYQRTHQLWEKGTVSRETLLSLNVPAKKRLSQIRVAMDRWRASGIGNDDYYVFVNVPDFHLEVWRNGVREQRFKTVVGATTPTVDPRTSEPGYGLATPSVNSEISRVVWDPYWWVPEQIENEELGPQLDSDPAYGEEMGFERAENHRGELVLRQKPGVRNALGRVKFEFENKHGIYMHDTPDRSIFGWPVRAESHGCIRLEDPVDLARALLANDMKWESAFEARSSTPRTINLSKPVPIHIEYYVVRVDDHGRVNFLADLYRRNTIRYRMAKKVGLGEEIPTSVLTP